MTPEVSTSDSFSHRGRNHRAMAIVAAIALHFVICALSLQVVETLIAYGAPISREPSPLIGMLQAWCSLAAIWWVRSRWPSPIKTLHVVLCFLAIWAVLVHSGERTTFSSVYGAGWLASLATQFAGTALGVMLWSFVRHGRSALPSRRFTLLFLVLWTFVIAVFLGTSRWIVERFGWTWDMLRWQYFPHLLVVGGIGAMQAAGLWAALHSRGTWRVRAIACAAIAAATMIAANLVLSLAFQSPGADPFEICRQFLPQALFILATLCPLEIAAQAGAPEWQSSDHRCSSNSATTG